MAVDARQKVVEAVEVKSGTDVNKRKQTRGKGNSTPARGRGSNDQTRIQNSTQLLTSSNGLHENSHHKVMFLCIVTYIHKCIHAYIHTYIDTYIFTHTYIYTYI